MRIYTEAKATYEVDLHVHTTASDGVLEPSEVVRHAASKGLKVIGITDHDSINGIETATACAAQYGVTCVPGVEISSCHEQMEIHILGLFLDWRDDSLGSRLSGIQKDRIARGERMVTRLREMGLPITIDAVRDIANGHLIGRMHIARALVSANVIANPQEAFTAEYIGSDGVAYFERQRISPLEAMCMISKAGGIPILAHPGNARSNAPIGKDLVFRLREWGLRGIETAYPEHSEGQTLHYSLLADELDLVKTGGSDFHGYEGTSHLGQCGITYDEFLHFCRSAGYPVPGPPRA